MSANKKVMIIVFLMLSLLSLATILNVWFNFLDYGKKTAYDKANSIAESVRDGLTSHMMTGTMDKRGIFLSNMIRHQNVQSLKVIRAKSVIDQFGDGKESLFEYDDMEKSVLKSGIKEAKMIENSNHRSFRITIPYIATKYSNPNCLSCHTNVKEGDVLGAISLELDISEVRDIGFSTIYKIVAITFIFLVIAILLAKFYIKPYIKLFDDLEEGISKAYRGDFSHYVTTNLSNEAGKVAKRLNDLSEIFRFKKTIELDSNKNKIYERIAYILEHNFEIKEFIIFENYITKKKKKVVFKSNALNFEIQEDIESSKNSCRANRTNLQVCSTDFHHICDLCYRKHKETLCLPFNVTDDLSLSLLIYVESKEELEKVRDLVPIITNYFELAEPVLETKYLMHKLHEKSLKDGMTGLYNRRFLDQFMENKLKDSDRFSVMMLDVDFFKKVNDMYGHDVGDEVIKGIAEVLKNNIKGSDLAIRYGGEEFLLMTFNTSTKDALKIANHIRMEFSKKVFKAKEQTFSKTLSVGVASYPDDDKNPWKVMKFADIALYNAKENGRDRAVLFESEMYENMDSTD